jgi:uncharacterized protein with PIN domain
MLGKLSRWLRLLGYEAIYANNSPDSSLVRKAREEGLILLTSDIALYRLAVARGVESYLIKGRTEPERLARLARRFRIRLAINPPKSLCTTCGGKLRRVERNKIKGRVPLTTFKTFRNFWECTESSCRKVYWQGSHWKNIREVLAEARELRRVGS